MSSINSRGYLSTAIISGLLFGAGLYVSQMVDPLKVLRFLDVAAIQSGRWDPSLAFVIVPAIMVMYLAVRYSDGMKAPRFNGRFNLPDFTQVDSPLVIGSALFGIGWGMSGICPGPAITLVAFMPQNLLVFLLPMFAGSFVGNVLMTRMTRKPAMA